MNEEWLDRAACKGHPNPEVFFPDKGECAKAREARAVCRTCPVQRECLAYAIEHNETNGIWGGISMGGRRRMARPRICDVCGNIFVRSAPSQKFCSESCATAMRAADRRVNRRPIRLQRAKVVVSSADHGTRSRYNAGCKCDPCTDAEARYSREYQRKRRKIRGVSVVASNGVKAHTEKSGDTVLPVSEGAA